jgi:heme exporter protein A
MGPVIRASGLGRRFARHWALRGVDLEVHAGAALMLVGRNGSGKTTLLRVLASLLRPTAGTLQVFGVSPALARDRLALLSHADGHYDDLTAEENLALGAAPRSVEAALAEVGLGSRAGDLVRTFSAGMRKRLAFARLLLKRPTLALLDEPYAALDPEGQAFADAAIRRLRASGATLVVATHQQARTAPLCDEAVVLEGGRVSWRGPPGDLPTGRSD